MIYTVTLNPALDYFMDYDVFQIGAVNRTAQTIISAGGKGIMESRMLSLLEVENTAFGFVGGFSGQFIKDFLSKNQILSNLTEIQEMTRINVKLKSQENETSFDAAGPQITDEEIQEFLIKFDNLKSDDIVVFAGTIPKMLGENFYERLIEKVKAHHAQFVMDVDGQKLLKMGAQHVIVSMAADGAYLFVENKVYFAAGIKGELKN